MKENFLKFKKKVWIEVLIKCAVAGVAAAVLAVNATLIPCKLYDVQLFWLYYVLIGLGGCALGFGIAFLFFRTDVKKIAKRLDAELCLQERVQTALVYGNAEGAMHELQREDTSDVLKNLPVKSLHFKNILAVALCGAIFLLGAVSVPVSATFIPPVLAPVQVDPDDNIRDVTDWEYAALDDLIEYVRNSKKADGPTKTGMLSQLESLRSLLLSTKVSESSLTIFVRNTVSAIRNVVSDANERPEVTEEQKQFNSEEETYVVNTLLEIFGLKLEGDEKPPTTEPDPGIDPDDPITPAPPPEGDINIDDVPFFDPEKGYVKCGEVREEYLAQLRAAMEEGLISEEEWANIVYTYFANLNGNNN